MADTDGLPALNSDPAAPATGAPQAPVVAENTQVNSPRAQTSTKIAPRESVVSNPDVPEVPYKIEITLPEEGDKKGGVKPTNNIAKR